MAESLYRLNDFESTKQGLRILLEVLDARNLFRYPSPPLEGSPPGLDFQHKVVIMKGFVNPQLYGMDELGKFADILSDYENAFQRFEKLSDLSATSMSEPADFDAKLDGYRQRSSQNGYEPR